MLLKFFKHDFKSLSRFGVPALFVIAGAMLLGCIDISTLSVFLKNDALENSSLSQFASVFTSLGLGISFIALYAAVITVTVMIYVRFYKTMVSDEGYLTMTLPVTPSKILLGKLISAILWILIVTAACLLAFAGIAGLYLRLLVPVEDAETMFEFSEYFFDTIKDYYVGSGNNISIVLYAVNIFISQISGMLLGFTSILFGGCVARKHKVLAAIGFYFGLNLVNQIISGVISLINSLIITSSGTSQSFVEANGAYSTLYFVMIMLLNVILTVAYFLSSRYIIARKMNL